MPVSYQLLLVPMSQLVKSTLLSALAPCQLRSWPALVTSRSSSVDVLLVSTPLTPEGNVPSAKPFVFTVPEPTTINGITPPVPRPVAEILMTILLPFVRLPDALMAAADGLAVTVP